MTSLGLDCVIRLPTNSSEPVPLAAPSEAWACGSRFPGLRVRIPLGHGCLSLVSVVCCQVEVSTSADHLSREVLPNVGCLSVIVKPRY